MYALNHLENEDVLDEEDQYLENGSPVICSIRENHEYKKDLARRLFREGKSCWPDDEVNMMLQCLRG